MESFLHSERYLATFREISVSDTASQEEAKRIFNARLTGRQRLELMNILTCRFYGIDDSASLPEIPGEIIFDRS